VTYGYNNLNQLTGYNDGATQGTLTYDAPQRRKLTETVNYGPFSLSHGYTYYANGLKKSFTGPDGVTVNYRYDSNNQLSSITLPTGTLTVNSYQWTAPTQITLPGGSTRTQGYDSLMRLKTIQVKDPAQNDVLNYQYAYDKADNITQKTTEHGTYHYGYDSLYRLTQATNPSPLTNETYTYDPAGNRTSDSTVPGSWSYNSNNQITAYGNVTPDYDANGNTTTKTEGSTTTTYVYDTTDRLTEVKDTSSLSDLDRGTTRRRVN
jgi:YD repeat-containing protein